MQLINSVSKYVGKNISRLYIFLVDGLWLMQSLGLIFYFLIILTSFLLILTHRIHLIADSLLGSKFRVKVNKPFTSLICIIMTNWKQLKSITFFFLI